MDRADEEAQVHEVRGEPDAEGSQVEDLERSENPMVTQISEAVSRGDFRGARALMRTINAELDIEALDERDREMIAEVQERLRYDLAELFVPLALIGVWLTLFFRSLP